MEQFQANVFWLQKMLPAGIPFPSTTVITGPGGAGKPLIGAILVNSWLEQGGTLVHLLINFDRTYSEKLLRDFQLDLGKYADKIVFVEFDPELKGIRQSSENMLQANLLKAEVFQDAIRQAKALLPKSDLGSLVYGSALNMLLFSPTFSVSIHQKIKKIVQSGENYLFTIANNTFNEQATVWENEADNLFATHVTGIMRLGFRVLRLCKGDFNTNETAVPITENELRRIRLEADAARKNLIPMLRKI